MIMTEARRAQVRELFNDGYNTIETAFKTSAHRNTVSSDLIALGLRRFSNISDDDLDEIVAREFREAHGALGAHALEARLNTEGYRIQRDRLRDSRRRLGLTKEPPKRIKRLAWYEARGPNGNAIAGLCSSSSI